MTKFLKRITSIFMIICFTLLQNIFVFANSLQDSNIAKGIEELITDATLLLMIVAPILGGLLIGYYFLRKSGADEMDQKTWQKRINTAIYSIVGVVVSSGFINIIIGYFN